MKIKVSHNNYEKRKGEKMGEMKIRTKKEEATNESELKEEEVNVKAYCDTNVKVACLTDCPGLTAWLSSNN